MNQLERRLALLRQYIPEMWDGQGKTCLYIGANPKRYQCGPELAAAGYEMTLLEIHEPYVQAMRDHAHVSHAIVGDVRQLPELPHEHYDLALWWHGPEHVEYEDIRLALESLEERADLVVLGCPWGEYEQGPVDENEWQTHRSAIYAEDLRRWGYRVVKAGQRDRPRVGYLIGWKHPANPLPRVYACIVAYNEEAMLPGCLESLQGQVSDIVVVDGAFDPYPHPPETAWSTDATAEIAQSYGAWVIRTPDGRAWRDQVEARTAYLVGMEGDWYFGIDADERIVGMLPVPEGGQHYAFQIDTRDLRRAWVPRLFQHRGHMRYEGSHNALWSDDRLIHMAGATLVDPGECHYLHLSHLRPAERQKIKRAFRRERDIYERPYRQLHGI